MKISVWGFYCNDDDDKNNSIGGIDKSNLIFCEMRNELQKNNKLVCDMKEDI